MLRSIRSRLTFANVTSMMALIVALSGTAFASTYVITRSSQIKNGVITNEDIRKGTLTSDRLAPAANVLFTKPGPAGPAGPAGAPGAPGLPGAPGGFNPAKVTYRAGAPTAIPATSFSTALDVPCLAGEKAISGAFQVTGTDPGTGFTWESRPAPDGGGWIISVDNHGAAAGSGYGVAVCAAP